MERVSLEPLCPHKSGTRPSLNFHQNASQNFSQFLQYRYEATDWTTGVKFPGGKAAGT